MNITTFSVRQNDILPYLDLLKQWRCDTFRQYPYLQITTPEYEDYYLKHYIYANNAILIIAKAEDKIIGAMTGIPLISDYEIFAKYQKKFIALFKKQNLRAQDYYYGGEILLSRQFHNLAVIEVLINKMEQEATLLNYKGLCFLKMKEESSHPLKPDNYQNLEPLDKFGFMPSTLELSYSWPTIQIDDTLKEQEHTLIFWLKNCNYSGVTKIYRKRSVVSRG